MLLLSGDRGPRGSGSMNNKTGYLVTLFFLMFSFWPQVSAKKETEASYSVPYIEENITYNDSDDVNESTFTGFNFDADDVNESTFAGFNFDADDDSKNKDGDESATKEGSESKNNIDPTGNGDGFAAILYNNSNGLPTSEANAIAETPDGFIWIGGYSGLTRYDGNNFSRIDSSTGIDSVVSLYVDSKERLWIGTNENGVALMERGDVSFFDSADELRSLSVRSIAEDNDGNIYIATTSGLAMINQSLELKALSFEELNSEYIVEIVCGKDGIIYGITNDGDVFGVKGSQLVYYFNDDNFKYNNLYCICPHDAKSGYVYLGTEKSEIVLVDLNDNMKIVKEYSVDPHIKVNKIDENNDHIWVCADNGVGLILSNGKYITINNLPMTSSIDDMISDYEGNLWFVSSRQGVMKIVPNIFVDINERAGLEDMVVNTTCVKDDLLYAGTDRGLVIIDKDNKRIENDLTKKLDSIRIRCIMVDSKETMWISTYSDFGLVSYDKSGNIVSYTEKDGLPSMKVRSTIESDDGRIYVATTGGVCTILNGEVRNSYGNERGLNNTEILSVCQGDDGSIYFGSDGDGIYKVNATNTFRISREDGLKSDVILKIKKDEKRGLYWIITSNSIAYLKDDVVTTIDKFPYSNNFDIFADDSDNLWILGSSGIYVVKAEQMIANDDIDYIFYDSNCGLPFIATANSFSCIQDDGTLYIAGNKGICKVNIKEHSDDFSDIRLSVPFVEADGKVIYPENDGIFVIPSNTKRLLIHGFAFTYTLKNPKINYEMMGIDQPGGITLYKKDLVPPSYTNLQGGEYTFKISIIGNGNTAGKELIVKVRKEKTITEKSWFKVLVVLSCAIVLGLIVGLYIRRKTKRLMKEQKKNQKFIDEMVEALARCVDVKDKYTNGHSFRVAQYTTMFAERMGYSEKELVDIHRIALLHDIGKISIPIDILNKPGKLTDEEFAVMKSHAAKGYEILKDITVMPNLALGAGYHHERYDGKGYPKGLKSDEIPMIAQIIAVADCLDAMTSTRPYRKGMPLEKAISIITEVSGTQLNPDVVNVFLQLVEEGAFDDLRVPKEGQ